MRTAVLTGALVAGCGGEGAVDSNDGRGLAGRPATGPEAPVARVDGSVLTVAQAATLLGANPAVRADHEVVRALADLWVDYTLLAHAVADTTGRPADVEALARPAREEALLQKLRTRVIHVPAAVVHDDETAEEVLRERDRKAQRARERARVAAGGRPAPPAPRDTLAARDHYRWELRHELAKGVRLRAAADSERAYLARLTAAADVRVAPSAARAVRDLALRDAELPPAERARPVATWTGGATTAGALHTLLRLQPAPTREAFTRATPAQADDVVVQLVRKVLLLRDAAARGVTLSAAEEDSVRRAVREGLLAQARGSALAPLVGRRAGHATADSAVRALLAEAIAHRQAAPSLGAAGAALRTAHAVEVAPAPVLRSVLQRIPARTTAR